MKDPLPPGFAVGKSGVEAARLALTIRTLCQQHRVNVIADLPPEALAQAVQAQARMDAIRASQRDELRERGLRGLAKANATVSARLAARFIRFREAVAERGGLAALNKSQLARDLDLSRSTVEKWCRKLDAEEQFNPPCCPTCRQPLPKPELHSAEGRLDQLSGHDVQ